MTIRLLKYYLITISFIGLLLLGCEINEIEGEYKEVLPPTTQIINVPPQNTVDNLYHALVKLSWKGYSDNAYIAGYHINWTSYFNESKDSVVQGAIFTKEMSMDIAFASPDSVNRHIITIKAEDNFGNIDPVGATGTYYTKKVIYPETSIVFPADSSEYYLSDNTNNYWKGIRLDFKASNEFWKIKDYSLRINKGEWQEWTTDTLTYLNYNSYSDLKDGWNEIEIRSRNNVFAVDQSPSKINIKIIKPTFENDYLIINDTEDRRGTTENPSDEQIDEFYSNILASTNYHIWDIEKNGNISRDEIGRYKYVLWNSDHYRKTNIDENTDVIRDYLRAGGRLCLTGWNLISLIDSKSNLIDNNSEFEGKFFNDYLQIYNTEFSVINTAALFSVKTEQNDYLDVDMSKLYSARKGLHKVITFTYMPPFSKNLLSYHTEPDSLSYEAKMAVTPFINKSVCYGYNNESYRLVVTGFPLFFLKEDAAKKAFEVIDNYLRSNSQL